jgi:predicted metal-dependent peptidase
MKIKFKLRSTSETDEMFTRAWDYAIKEYVKKRGPVPVSTYSAWKEVHNTNIRAVDSSHYEVEMSDQEYLMFFLKWS